MDKNTITGFILIAILLIGFSYYNQDQYAEQATLQAQQDSIALVEQAKAHKQHVADSLVARAKADSLAADTTSLFAAQRHMGGEVAPIVLHNSKVSVEINPVGAVPSRVLLNEYKNYDDFAAKREQALVLFDSETASMDLTFETKDLNVATHNFRFVPVSQTDSTVTLRLADRTGTLDFTYELLPDNYMVNLTIHAVGLGNVFPARCKTFALSWHDRVRQQEKGFYFENMYSTLTYRSNGDTEKLSEQKAETEQPTHDVDWVAFKNQYFSAVLIGGRPLTAAQLSSEPEEEGSGYLKHYTCDAEVNFDPTGAQPTQLQFYFGPNNYRLLQSMEDSRLAKDELNLQTLVYLGWPRVRCINRFFTLYVFDWLTKLGLPMGVVLLIITLLLRVIVYSPTKKSYMSSAKMRVLRPKMDEITAKYPNPEDAMKRQQEMMTLQSQYGVNPMGGCLPMLIQMPIWIAMFNFVPNAIELRQQSLLWAEDLSTYDSLLSWSVDLPIIGNHLSLFCLLFCATNVVYSWLNMRQQRDTMAMAPEQAQQMKMMQWMMYLMPVMFFFMFNKYSAGLNFYYFISLLFSALTMWYLRITTDDAKLLAKLEENYRKNKQDPNKQPTGLAARLAALQEQQEQLLKEKQARYQK
ncbi:MAG: membrane protein insertase YidC [Bacteroidaceae bacterium]|nr:membrane protein insertase YidC [Bacteroidaceae bacterium]